MTPECRIAMETMTYEEKLSIAKAAYKQIMAIIEPLEEKGIVHCHWDECITVIDEMFQASQMREDK